MRVGWFHASGVAPCDQLWEAELRSSGFQYGKAWPTLGHAKVDELPRASDRDKSYGLRSADLQSEEIRTCRNAGTMRYRSRRVLRGRQPAASATVSELVVACEAHPTMIPQWKASRLEGAAGLFERGGKAAATAVVVEGTVCDLHGGIGELAVAHDLLGQKAQALDREVRHSIIERTHYRLLVGAQCQLLSIARLSFSSAL